MVEIINVGMVNCYLIRGKNGSVLVDTGIPSNGKKIYEAVKNKNVRLILLTHGHMDHTGNTAYLKEKLHVPVAMHQADYELLKDNSVQKCHADTLIGKIILIFSNPRLFKKPESFEPDLFIEPGDDLRKYGVNGEIIGLPGHTAGSIGVWLRNEVIVGDAIMNFVKPYRARIYADKQQAEKSLEVIKATNTLMIYPGHGAPVELDQFFKKKK